MHVIKHFTFLYLGKEPRNPENFTVFSWENMLTDIYTPEPHEKFQFLCFMGFFLPLTSVIWPYLKNQVTIPCAAKNEQTHCYNRTENGSSVFLFDKTSLPGWKVLRLWQCQKFSVWCRDRKVMHDTFPFPLPFVLQQLHNTCSQLTILTSAKILIAIKIWKDFLQESIHIFICYPKAHSLVTH